MGHDLMAIEVKVHPLIRATSLRAAQKAPIKASGLGKIINRKGEMEGMCNSRHGGMRSYSIPRNLA
jgi:hypothetical protein